MSRHQFEDNDGLVKYLGKLMEKVPKFKYSALFRNFIDVIDVSVGRIGDFFEKSYLLYCFAHFSNNRNHFKNFFD